MLVLLAWHVCVPTEDEAEHSLVDKEVSQVGKQTELVELLSSKYMGKCETL